MYRAAPRAFHVISWRVYSISVMGFAGRNVSLGWRPPTTRVAGPGRGQRRSREWPQWDRPDDHRILPNRVPTRRIGGGVPACQLFRHTELHDASGGLRIRGHASGNGALALRNPRRGPLFSAILDEALRPDFVEAPVNQRRVGSTRGLMDSLRRWPVWRSELRACSSARERRLSARVSAEIARVLLADDSAPHEFHTVLNQEQE